MTDLFDFFGSPAGVELLRILDSLGTILAAILSGAALSNVTKVRTAIGGVVRRTLLQWIRDLLRTGFRKPRHGTTRSAKVVETPLTLDERVDLLQKTQERMWVNNGRAQHEILRRLEKIDPPTGRRRGEPDDR